MQPSKIPANKNQRVIDKYGPCPCDSKKPYHKCCRPFHQGELPSSALLLMRSRYAAYALGLCDYIMATTHTQSRLYCEDKLAWSADLDAFASQTSFDGLKILNFEESGDTATVAFRAYLRAGGQDVGFSEKSSFARVDGRWLYIDGLTSD
ncbi:MAG: zinc chelation protein SecC [Cyanobacteria bacterium SZAS TMP-1]|nr:zinc chelation protein SecC [Cyanobacteria bacterium SZAS TMP-1]